MAYNPRFIVAAREQLGMSQRELAGEIGVVHSTVYRWETENQVPTGKHMADVLDLVFEKVGEGARIPIWIHGDTETTMVLDTNGEWTYEQ